MFAGRPEQSELKHAGVVFVLNIALSLVLPIAGDGAARVKYGLTPLLSAIGGAVSEFQFVIWFVTVIPFLVLGVATVNRINHTNVAKSRWIPIGLASTPVYVMTFDVYYGVQASVLEPGPGSSTASIAHVFGPLYSLFGIGVGLAIGWGVERLLGIGGSTAFPPE